MSAVNQDVLDDSLSALLVRLGVRSWGWRRAVHAVHRFPEDGVHLRLRDRVELPERQAVRERRPWGSGRVARQEVDIRGDGVHWSGVERLGGERGVHRGGQSVVQGPVSYTHL